MEFDANVEHLRLAFWQIILTAGPILGTGGWSYNRYFASGHVY